ncbi:MAPEG family protein [bacterium]|nr:MAPEG family protein [bacterium]
MQNENKLLLAIVVLGAWTMFMWFWMYYTRIPAILKMKLKLDPKAARGEQMNSLPAQVRWKADNYNHLFEQPTLFYAVVLVLFLLRDSSDWAVYLAWSYVVIRILHSLVQAIINKIELRFSLFVLSSLSLIGLIVKSLFLIFK